MPTYKKAVTSVTVGANSTTAVIYVAEKVATSEGGDFVKPRTVANTVAPVGVIHAHKWWEITVAIDEEDEAMLFTADLISPNTTYVTTLGEGVIVPSVYLVITEKNTAGTSRTITYTNVYVKNWSNKTTNNEDHQPIEITFLSYGTRTATAWA